MGFEIGGQGLNKTAFINGNVGKYGCVDQSDSDDLLENSSIFGAFKYGANALDEPVLSIRKKIYLRLELPESKKIPQINTCETKQSDIKSINAVNNIPLAENVNLENSLLGKTTIGHGGNDAALEVSTKVKITKDSFSVYQSIHAGVKKDNDSLQITNTTGIEYQNENGIGVNISSTYGAGSKNSLNFQAKIGDERMNASVDYSKNSPRGDEANLSLGYSPKKGVNLNAGYSTAGGNGHFSTGIGYQTEKGINLNAGYSTAGGNGHFSTGIGYQTEKGVNLNAGYSTEGGNGRFSTGIELNNNNGIDVGINMDKTAVSSDIGASVKYKGVALGLSQLSKTPTFSIKTCYTF